MHGDTIITTCLHGCVYIHVLYNIYACLDFGTRLPYHIKNPSYAYYGKQDPNLKQTTDTAELQVVHVYEGMKPN